MSLDLKRLRSETPCCSLVTHFNHAGASPAPMAVLDAVTAHLQREAMYGPMEAGAAAASQVEAVRQAAAELIGSNPAEIAFAASGSAAAGMAFAALPPLRRGDRILVGRQEWGGNLATMQRAAEAAGAGIEVIPCAADGSVCTTALAGMLDARVRLVALTWLPANGGLINPAAEIGRITRDAGVPYFIDAGQALGQIPVDVKALGCDVLKGAARKYLRAPRGTALLYVRQDFLSKLRPAYLDVASAPWHGEGYRLRDDARRFEHAEIPVAGLLGLGAALRYALDLGIDNISARIASLAQALRSKLSSIEGIRLHDLGSTQSGLVSFTLAGIEAAEVRRLLALRKINVGANGIPYTPLDMQARGLRDIARASVSYFNTEEELDELANALKELAQST